MRYWGKTLLFSAYSVVPEILSERIKYELEKRLKARFSKICSDNYDSLFSQIIIPEGCNVFDNLNDEDRQIIKQYFSSDHAKRVLLAVYGQALQEDYWGCVSKYCEEGCFADVLDEFKFMRDNMSEKPSLKTYLNNTEDNGYCDCFNGKGDELIKKLNRFNSPFYPFSFLLTSVAEEGFDFHWYADRIVHWNAPSTPIALLQREGRVDRINSMAVRKTIARKTGRTDLCWSDLIEKYRSSPENKDQAEKCMGMFPNFWAGEDAERIHRYCYYYPYSSDHFRWEILIKNLEYYRSMFGASNNLDLNNTDAVENEHWETLKKLNINISIRDEQADCSDDQTCFHS